MTPPLETERCRCHPSTCAAVVSFLLNHLGCFDLHVWEQRGASSRRASVNCWCLSISSEWFVLFTTETSPPALLRVRAVNTPHSCRHSGTAPSSYPSRSLRRWRKAASSDWLAWQRLHLNMNEGNWWLEGMGVEWYQDDAEDWSERGNNFHSRCLCRITTRWRNKTNKKYNDNIYKMILLHLSLSSSDVVFPWQ